MANAKKKRSLKSYTMDISFYSIDITVNAYSQGEARKKAIAKLKRKSISSLINKQNTYIGRSD